MSIASSDAGLAVDPSVMYDGEEFTEPGIYKSSVAETTLNVLGSGLSTSNVVMKNAASGDVLSPTNVTGTDILYTFPASDNEFYLLYINGVQWGVFSNN